MKRFLTILATFALASAGVTLPAQERQMFNHLAVGITAGLDGTGLEAVVPVASSLHIRGGYSFFPYSYKTNVDFGVAKRDSAYDLDLTNLPVKGGLWRGGVGKLLLDIYPYSQGALRFVAGAFLGNGKIVAGTADFRSVLETKDYRTGVGYKDIFFSTDDKGFVYMDIAGFKVLPYLGLGIGTPLNPDRRLSFSMEVGAFYTGGTKVQTYDFSRDDSGQISIITGANLKDDDGNRIDKGYVDKVSGIHVLPMLRFGLYLNLF